MSKQQLSEQKNNLSDQNNDEINNQQNDYQNNPDDYSIDSSYNKNDRKESCSQFNNQQMLNHQYPSRQYIEISNNIIKKSTNDQNLYVINISNQQNLKELKDDTLRIIQQYYNSQNYSLQDYQSKCMQLEMKLKDTEQKIKNAEQIKEYQNKKIHEFQKQQKQSVQIQQQQEQQIFQLQQQIRQQQQQISQLQQNQQVNQKQEQTQEIQNHQQEINCNGQILDQKNYDRYPRYEVELQESLIMNYQQLIPQLTQEIKQFESEVDAYNNSNKQLFDELITKFSNAIRQEYQNAKIYIYGSFATQLCLPWSDIDLVIQIDPQYYGENQNQILMNIENLLKKQKDFIFQTQHISKAVIQVLKITCTKEYKDKKLDITIQEPMHNGLRCVDLVNEYILFYKPLKALVLVLKQFLYASDLNDTYTGGLSSYSLILMIVYFLQIKLKTEDIRFTENNDYSWPPIGQLLIDFLIFYGMDDYKYKYVRPHRIEHQNNVNTYLVDASYDIINQGKIQILDPLNPQNNVSRSTFKYQNIKIAFSIGYSILHQVYQCKSNCKNKQNCQNDIYSCLILRRFFNLPNKAVITQPTFQPLFQPQQYYIQMC